MMWQLKYQDAVEEGRSEGITERAVSDLKNLMRNTGWPLEQELTVLEVPRKDWVKYIEMLANQ